VFFGDRKSVSREVEWLRRTGTMTKSGLLPSPRT